MSICAIVPMYNHGDMTRKCVEYTLKNAGVDIDILVVDDGSIEPYIDDRVTVLRLNINSGYTYATNQGILWAMEQKFDYVLLLNNDTEPEPNFVKLLLEAIEKDSAIGIAGSARIIWGEKGAEYIENFGLDLVTGYQAYTKEDIGKEIVYVAWIPVCSALIPMRIIQQVGLLDRRMRNFCSDNDYCVRVQEMGYRVALVPQSKIKHFHQHTVKSLNLEGSKDQQILLAKLSCNVQKQFLDTYPLDWDQQTWGKLDFTVYHKDKVPYFCERETISEHKDDKLNQSATAYFT